MCHGFLKGMILGTAVGMAAGMVLAPKKKSRPCKMIKCAGEILDNLAEMVWK